MSGHNASSGTILQGAASLANYVISCRRTLHRLAEVSGKEYHTSAFLRAEIERIGLAYEAVGETGLLATLDTGRDGPHIALRADIDALPVRESPRNTTRERVCVSDDPNACHACGHDAHAAMLLGAMHLLCGMKSELCGTVYFCFEAGEENGIGVRPMLEKLSTKRVDTVWAIHVYADLASGRINVEGGARMGGAAGVDVTFIGRGGHGARPDLAVNPVFCAASFLNNLAAAFVNQIDANETVTLGVTSIQCGESYNVIPETAQVRGSLRFFCRSEGEKAARIVQNTALHTAGMFGCRAEIGAYTAVVAEPVVNDAACASFAQEALIRILPAETIAPCARWFASESFGRYLMRYPGVLAFLGIRNESQGSGAPHHSPSFDVDETVLPLGVAATVQYTLAVMEHGVPQRLCNNEKENQA